MFDVVVIMFEEDCEVESYRESYRVCASEAEAERAAISAYVEYSEQNMPYEVMVVAIIEE